MKRKNLLAKTFLRSLTSASGVCAGSALTSWLKMESRKPSPSYTKSSRAILFPNLSALAFDDRTQSRSRLQLRVDLEWLDHSLAHQSAKVGKFPKTSTIK